MHKNLQDKLAALAEAEKEASEVEAMLERITQQLHMVGLTGDLQRLRMTYEFLTGDHRELNRHNHLYNKQLDKLKEEGNVKGKERTIVGLLIVVLTFLLIFSVVGAQEPPLVPSNTPLVIEGLATPISSTAVPVDDLGDVVDVLPTEEAPVVIINNQPPPDPAPASPWSDRLMYIVGFFIFLIYTGIKEYAETRKTESLVNTVNKGLDNKQIQDEARERYMQASMENKEFISLLGAVFKVIGNLNIPGIDPAVDKTANWIDNLTNPQPPPAPPEIPTIPDPDPFPPQYPGDKPLSSYP